MLESEALCTLCERLLLPRFGRLPDSQQAGGELTAHLTAGKGKPGACKAASHITRLQKAILMIQARPRQGAPAYCKELIERGPWA